MSAYAVSSSDQSPSPLSSPSTGLPSNQKGICSHSRSPHTIAVFYLSSSLPLSFYGFEIITIWFFPSSKQIFVSEFSLMWNDTELLQCMTLPSKSHLEVKANCPVSDGQKPNLFCARQKAKSFANCWWFPAAMAFASQSCWVCIYLKVQPPLGLLRCSFLAHHHYASWLYTQNKNWATCFSSEISC